MKRSLSLYLTSANRVCEWASRADFRMYLVFMVIGIFGVGLFWSGAYVL